MQHQQLSTSDVAQPSVVRPRLEKQDTLDQPAFEPISHDVTVWTDTVSKRSGVLKNDDSPDCPKDRSDQAAAAPGTRGGVSSFLGERKRPALPVSPTRAVAVPRRG